MLKLMEVRKQKFQLKYLLKRIKIKIEFFMAIVILVFALHNEHC